MVKKCAQKLQVYKRRVLVNLELIQLILVLAEANIVNVAALSVMLHYINLCYTRELMMSLPNETSMTPEELWL